MLTTEQAEERDREGRHTHVCRGMSMHCGEVVLCELARCTFEQLEIELCCRSCERANHETAELSMPQVRELLG